MSEINWDDEPTAASTETVVVQVPAVRLKAIRNSKGWNTELSVTSEATQSDCDTALQRLDYLKAQMEARFG